MSDGKNTLVCLVGEQPLPNLLPALREMPGRVLLACTESTTEVCERLKEVMQRRLGAECEVVTFSVPAYQIRGIHQRLTTKVKEYPPDRPLFNLTGGTKAMAFAAFSLARELHARILYLDSDEHPNRIYYYRFPTGDEMPPLPEEDSICDLGNLITLKDYLDVHLDNHWTGKSQAGNEKGLVFEQLVTETLKASHEIDEIKCNVKTRGDLEIDLIVRRANRVGIAELKTGTGATQKRPIEQLNTAARREFLGIYTQKLLIVNREWDPNATLRPLVFSSNIKLIELPSFTEESLTLSESDRTRLVREVVGSLRAERA